MKRMAIKALPVALLAAFLFAGTAHAQTSDLEDPGMLPDHPMYFAKSMSESIGTFFTFGEANEAERALELSEKRLAEAHALAAEGKADEAEKAVERYEAQLDRAVTKAERARADGDDGGEALGQVSEATSRHQAVLAEVHQKVPEEARPGIERAMEASKRGHSRAEAARSGARGGPGARGQGPPGDRGRPESAGPPDFRGQGPPDAPDTDRPDADDRPERGPPDSVDTGRPDGTGGR